MAGEVGYDKLIPSIASATFINVLTYTLWALVIGAVVFFVWRWWREKQTYKNPVRIFRQRQNGTRKEFNTRGGYLTDKAGVVSFWIILTRWKKFKMATLPDPDAIDEEDRIYYHQISPVDYIQTKAEFCYEDVFIPNPTFKEPTFEEGNRIIESWASQLAKERSLAEISPELKEEALVLYNDWLEKNRGEWINKGKVVFNPITQPSKLSAINDLSSAMGVLGVDANKQFLYFVIGAICIIALGAIVFYIASNEGHMPILELAPLLLKKNKFK